jgi:hypothetical protein
MPRTFRDQKAMAYEAARFAKTQNPARHYRDFGPLERNQVGTAGGWPDRIAASGPAEMIARHLSDKGAA